MIALAIPFGIVGAFGGFRGSLREIHHGLLAAYSGRALSDLITESLKNRVGRLRPDFLARCKWDAATRACTGKLGDIIDGRRSFPSGHSSTAFVGMTFLSLFLAGKTAAWCFHAPAPPRSFLGSRLLRFVLSLLPMAFASWVAVSRVEDYRHHKEDVIVGSIIGIVSASVCYLIFWPNPFSIDSFSIESAGRPRAVYREHDFGRSRNTGYELTDMDHDIEPV
ncbi:lipid phosphate phosphatase [Heterobasidion irregulare TC 32-1]|uniref:Lipid phosphate phosphatase n=1 Tax=Heterobasidion irregulare (strain TC 32-1) TaxID=747525 RepID=W4JZX2_HETIT|nr:lipid phosphate phosphatase [Heterobasidion irregulare TC 32-1]ETW78640.1 lipid phosphate phosphatase [Heterobasidion irregulare TC 32-1]